MGLGVYSAQSAVMGSDRRLHVFVLIDALGWQVIQGRDFLSDILPHRTPLRTVLGYSSAAVPSILTGMVPSQHGHWNLFYYDPTGSPFRWLRHLHFLPDAVFDYRVTRKLLKEMGRRLLGLGPLFECCVSPRILHLFNWVEKRDIYDRRGIIGAPSIFDRLAEEGIPHHVYSYHDGSDDTILRQAKRDIETGEGKFFFVYLSEMDAFLHFHRGDPAKIAEQLAVYETRLRTLFESTRRVDPEASLTVFSDHGMTPIHCKYDLLKEIDDLGLRMPDDYLAVYDSTMARFWFFSPQAREKVTATLSAVRCGRTLTDAELETLGVLFPDGRYG
ncbi:MAG TPA: alkaline phosphatase family protein, partial [Candidatus Acidoferrum sp.]|nr:alkaline phosphatase family protein [Candidatus Acidoferrum sp.]